MIVFSSKNQRHTVTNHILHWPLTSAFGTTVRNLEPSLSYAAVDLSCRGASHDALSVTSLFALPVFKNHYCI